MGLAGPAELGDRAATRLVCRRRDPRADRRGPRSSSADGRSPVIPRSSCRSQSSSPSLVSPKMSSRGIGVSRTVALLTITAIVLNSSADGKLEVNSTDASRSIDGPEGRERASFPPRTGDSYLEALWHSRHSDDPREGIVGTDPSASRRESAPGEEYRSPGTRGARPGTERTDRYDRNDRVAYGPPPRTRPSRPGLSVSSGDYGDYSYLPTQQAYGSSEPSHPYGYSELTPFSNPPTVHLAWPFALKLNAFTLAKILLKLVIFKMIVKFVALVCLLLFVPKLEIKRGNKGGSAGNNGDAEEEEDEDEDGGRGFLGGGSADRTLRGERLNDLTALVESAIEKYESLNRSRADPVFDDSPSAYARLIYSYALEEKRPI